MQKNADVSIHFFPPICQFWILKALTLPVTNIDQKSYFSSFPILTARIVLFYHLVLIGLSEILISEPEKCPGN